MGSEKDMRWAMKIQSETHFSNIADIDPANDSASQLSNHENKIIDQVN